MQADALPDATAADNGHRTARRAVELLCQLDASYRCPTRSERDALLVAFAKHRKTLHTAAFDAVRLAAPLDLVNADAIADQIDLVTICEVKSTNRTMMGANLKGYFFNITAAEMLTAQGLGRQYRFVFVNTLTGHHQEMSLQDVMGRARAMYPAWHIRF